MRTIIKYPNTVLKTRCPNVDLEKEIKLIKELEFCLYAHNAVGIAANQIGELKNLFLVLDIKTDKCLVFANSEIISYSKDSFSMNEGCLSFPDLVVRVKRPKSVQIKFDVIEQDKIETKICEFDGISARIIQHEYDHTNGIVFTERELFRSFKRK